MAGAVWVTEAPCETPGVGSLNGRDRAPRPGSGDKEDANDDDDDDEDGDGLGIPDASFVLLDLRRDERETEKGSGARDQELRGREEQPGSALDFLPRPLPLAVFCFVVPSWNRQNPPLLASQHSRCMGEALLFFLASTHAPSSLSVERGLTIENDSRVTTGQANGVG